MNRRPVNTEGRVLDVGGVWGFWIRDSDEHAGNRRTEHTRQIVGRRVDCGRRHQILRGDELDEKGLPGGNLERGGETE